MQKKDNSGMAENIEYLEKVFKKLSPHMLSSPYIPTPSLLIKGPEFEKETLKDGKKSKLSPTTKPTEEPEEKYEEVLDCLHKGAYAYSIGDYGTAINHFTRLLEIEWLKHSVYFYLIKTLIKLDIEKELLLLRTKIKTNKVKMTKI